MAVVHKQEEKTSFLRKLGNSMVAHPALFALVLLIVLFAFITPRFFTSNNLKNILSQVAINSIVAFGMTFVITSGEIDLSVGSVLCVSSMVYMLMSTYSLHVIVGAIVALGVGVAVGLINGLIITWLEIPSFIVTLALMSIGRGVALLTTGGGTIFQGIQPSYLVLGQGTIMNIALPIFILFLLFLLSDFVYKKTVFGEYTRAIGSNSEAARLAGISTNKMSIKIFILSGILAAIAGILTASRLGVGSPKVGTGTEMDAITAVVLGGTSFSGGSGTIRGTLVGALVVAVLNNGLTLMGVSSYWQQVVLGFVLVLALSLKKIQIVRRP
jgi:ribose/xylose/arabinose/galactoside ABC-type transport system permease subunit